jgi:hypothetical protein
MSAFFPEEGGAYMPPDRRQPRLISDSPSIRLIAMSMKRQYAAGAGLPISAWK